MIAELLARLEERSETLAVAESLTGGLLSATIVEVPGASRVFRGGLVVYATDLKHSLAGVDAQLLDDLGPVSAEVALELARGARSRCTATWGLATTGVAGPGPQDGIPAGTVFVGLSGATEAVQRLDLAGDRDQIRRATVAEALALLASAVT